MSQKNIEFENWKNRWLSISGEKSLYHNKIKSHDIVLEPDMCHRDVVVNFISSTPNVSKLYEETKKYNELGYRVYYVINLITEFDKNKMMKVREDDGSILFEFLTIYNVLNKVSILLDKSNIYFQIDNSQLLYKFEKSNHECLFWINKSKRISTLDFITKIIFGYRSRLGQ